MRVTRTLTVAAVVFAASLPSGSVGAQAAVPSAEFAEVQGVRSARRGGDPLADDYARFARRLPRTKVDRPDDGGEAAPKVKVTTLEATAALVMVFGVPLNTL